MNIFARKLLEYSTDQLISILSGDITLIFDNNEEVVTNDKECIYSSYFWDLHREYPATPLLPMHHVRSIIGDGRLGSSAHLELVGKCMWSVYEEYVHIHQSNGISAIVFRDILSKRVYQIVNTVYNELSIMSEGFVQSLDILDFIEVTNNPVVKTANNTILPTQKSIDDTYKVIKDSLYNDPSLKNNTLALAVRGRLVSIDQVLQCVSARGFITDTDSVIFPKPIIVGYVRGLRSFHDSFIESRSAAKSLIFSKSPLQQAEYFSRRLQLMTEVVQNLHPGDCGSTEYVLWHVRGAEYNGTTLMRKSDLDQIAGKIYMDTDGILKVVNGKDKSLLGRTLKLRTTIHCSHPDPYGVCSTCFGVLADSVPANTNLGQICCTALAQKSSQSVLSVKHLDGSSVIAGIILNDFQKKYLKVSSDNNSYLLSPNILNKQVKLIIPAAEAANISDIMEVRDILDLNITRVSVLTEIGIIVDNVPETFKVNINQRLASMTYSLLAYMRTSGWEIDVRGNYVVDMSNWDWNLPMMTLPLRHYNLSDHSAEISTLLESSVTKLKERDTNASPNTALVELFDLVNDKLTVNLAVLEVVLYATMVVSNRDDDYGLPKTFTTSALGVMKNTISNRSLSAAMAYESHRELITSPKSFINTNRLDHVFDYLLCYHD